MNYLKGYLSLIRKAERRGWDRKTAPVMTEKHHIFPRSIYGKDRGGTNKRCVYLTLREHYIAHALLMKGFIKRYGIDDDRSAKMIYAFHMMNIMRERIGYPNSYLYETSREHYINMRIGRKRKPFSPEHIEKLRQRGLGENNHFYGKKHKEESKQKQRVLMTGRYDGEKNPFYGKKHSEETREKMKKAWEVRNCKLLCSWSSKWGLSLIMAPLVSRSGFNLGFGRRRGGAAASGSGFSVTGGNVSALTPGNGYKYHTFTSPGTLTVSVVGTPGTIELLMIGGGGGGGNGAPGIVIIRYLT